MLTPQLNISADRIQGCTPWLARVLVLGSSSRCIEVNRRLRHIILDTRSFWLFKRSRVVAFDNIARVVFTAQTLPTLSPWRYLSLNESGHSDSALFNISLVLRNGRQLHLFTIWQRQPRDSNWLDRLAGTQDEVAVGDEAATHIVTVLKRYLDVPIARY